MAVSTGLAPPRTGPEFRLCPQIHPRGYPCRHRRCLGLLLPPRLPPVSTADLERFCHTLTHVALIEPPNGSMTRSATGQSDGWENSHPREPTSTLTRTISSPRSRRQCFGSLPSSNFFMTNSLNAFGYFAPTIISNIGFTGCECQRDFICGPLADATLPPCRQRTTFDSASQRE
jgi:hypothetical protein